MCLTCVFFLLKLYQQVQCVLCIYRCFAFWFCDHPLHIFAICPPSQIIVACNSLSLLSPHFFVITIMEFSIPNTFVSMEVEPNGLCVGVGHLTRCNNNNIVSRLEQEALFENSSNIGINDLIVQEVLLENLKKQVKLCKPHSRAFHIWTFFKVNND